MEVGALVDESAVQQVLSSVKQLGPVGNWVTWPGGWRDDVEAALVDAVFSARAVYRTRRGEGVHAQVVRWRDARPRTSFSVDALCAEIDHHGVEGWAELFGNRQVSPGRPADAPGGPMKAATVRQAGGELLSQNIYVAGDVYEASVGAVRHCLRSVPGIGLATANYFSMLLGWPGSKPDRMVHRFLEGAVGYRVGPREAVDLIAEVAARLGVSEVALDHAIWSAESAAAAG